MPFAVGLVLIFVGRIIWRKGNPDESVLLAILSWMDDLFTGQLPSSIRTLAVLVYVLGSFAIFVGIMRIIKLLMGE